MRYSFKDIFNNSLYDTANILIVAGQYQIFNNLVIDKCRELCKSEIDDIDMEYLHTLMAGMPTNESSLTDSGSNTVTLEEFMEVNKAAPLDGRWYCNINYEAISAKEKEKIKEYFKFNNKNGLMVVNITKWMDYREFLKNRVIGESKTTHIIQLSFPNKDTLKELVKTLFNNLGYKVREEAIELFIMRMSNAYDSYNDSIDKIVGYVGEIKEIDYNTMKEAMTGIENYVLDDFIIQLTKKMGSSKLITSRKVYKMYKSLYESMGPIEIVKALRNKIDILIELRVLINMGIIPIKVRYSVSEVKRRLDKLYPEEESVQEETKESKETEEKKDTDKEKKDTDKDKDKKKRKKKTAIQTVKGLTNFSFKKYARISSKTSLRDWYYIKMMLYSGSEDVKYLSKEQAERILLAVLHRTTFTPSRLINDIGVDSVTDNELFNLNTVLFNPFINRFDPDLKKHIDEVTEKVNQRVKESKYEEVVPVKRKKAKSTKIKIGEDNIEDAKRVQSLLELYRLEQE